MGRSPTANRPRPSSSSSSSIPLTFSEYEDEDDDEDDSPERPDAPPAPLCSAIDSNTSSSTSFVAFFPGRDQRPAETLAGLGAAFPCRPKSRQHPIPICVNLRDPRAVSDADGRMQQLDAVGGDEQWCLRRGEREIGAQVVAGSG